MFTFGLDHNDFTAVCHYDKIGIMIQITVYTKLKPIHISVPPFDVRERRYFFYYFQFKSVNRLFRPIKLF